MPDPAPIPGLHHVTAISGPAQETVDFYARTLGLRLVKTTVNFDDPGTYHLYVGDRTGQPGTALTFFPWAHAAPGTVGAGMAGDVAFAVPPDALPFWRARLAEAGVDASDATRGGEARLHLTAPDGLPLALVATAAADPDAAWTDGPVPAEHALCGFYGTTLHVPDPGPVADLLTEVFGWTEPAASVEDAAEDAGAGDALRRVTGTAGALGRVIDLHATDAAARAGAGTIHHIAFRVPDDAAQRAYRAALTARGLFVTDVKDRQYFRSIYFRDARHTGGVLFEIATDGPGFTDDEPVATLGTALKLPPWLEERRAEIARRLPALDRP